MFVNGTVGVVSGIERDVAEGSVVKFSVIGGDFDNSVAEAEYVVSEAEIAGFIMLPANPEEVVELEPISAEAYAGDYGVMLLSQEIPEINGGALYYAGEDAIELPNSTTTIEWHPSHDGIETSVTQWNPITDSTVLPPDAHLRINTSFIDVDPQTLKDHGYQLIYYGDDSLANLVAESTINIAGEERGIIRAQTVEVNGKTMNVITLTFDQEWVDDLVKHNDIPDVGKKTIYGEFRYQSELDLKALENGNGSSVTINGITINTSATDPIAQFANISMTKTAEPKLIKGEDGHYYLKYTVTVTAGEYGAPDVKVLDGITSGYVFVEEFVGVTGEKLPANNGDVLTGPVETVSNGSAVGSVYKTSCIKADINNAAGTDGSSTVEVISGNGKVSYVPKADANGNNVAWYIGDMEPNEVRALTYAVRVKDSYVGISHPNQPITNQAQLLSKNYNRGEQARPYQPTVNSAMTKSHENVRKEGDDWFVDYTIRVNADSTNAYPLTNLKVSDVANGRSGNYSDRISIVNDSVKLYAADGTTEIEYESLTIKNNNRDFDMMIGDLNPGESKIIKYSMKLSAQDIEAVANGIIGINNVAKLHENPEVSNRVLAQRESNVGFDSQVWTRKLGGEQERSDKVINFANRNHVYDLTGNSLVKIDNPGVSYTIPAGDIRYTIVVNEDGDWDVSGANLRDNLGTNNVQGEQKNILIFDGYIELKVYDRIEGSNDENDIINRAGSMTPKDVYYIKIDKKSNFNLVLKDLGITGEDAYVLTYYAKFNGDVSGWTQADVDNRFYLSGDIVGPGGNHYNLIDNIYSSKQRHLVEPGTEDPIKQRWYYDTDYRFVNDYTLETVGYDDSFPSYNDNGALYWVIQWGGAKINANTVVQDSTRIDGNWDNQHEVISNNNGRLTYSKMPYDVIRYKDSFVGIYSGSLGKKEDGTDYVLGDLYPDYDSFMSAVARGEFHAVDSSYYTLSFGQGNAGVFANPENGASDFYLDKDGNKNFDLTLTFNKTYAFDNGEKLFIIIRTQPTSLPDKNSVQFYANKYNYKLPNRGWEDGKNRPVYQNIYGDSAGILKRTEGVYQITAGSVKNIVNNSVVDANNEKSSFRKAVYTVTGTGVTDNIMETRYGDNYTLSDGIYVSWLVSANTMSSLNGVYSIVDSLPEGLDLEYVRTYEAGWHDYNNSNLMVQNVNFVDPDYFGPGTTVSYNDKNLPVLSINNNKVAYNFTERNEALSDAGWTEYYTATRMHDRGQNNNFCGTYYYVKDNQIRIDTNYKRSRDAITYQIVCKVNDVGYGFLEYGNHDFDNNVELVDKAGKVIDESGSVATVTGGNVSKSNLANIAHENLSSGQLNTINTTNFPYEIVLNENGANMDSNDENGNVISIPFVDRMSDNLSLQAKSLKIYATSYKDGKAYSDKITMSEGNLFKVEKNRNVNQTLTNFSDKWNNYANFFVVEKNDGSKTATSGVVTNSHDGQRHTRELQNTVLVVGANSQEIKEQYEMSGNRLANDQALNFEFENGYYISYFLNVDNSDGSLDNTPLDIINELPEGVSLAYVRTYSGANSNNYPFDSNEANTKNLQVQVTRKCTSGAFDGWYTGAVASVQTGLTYWINTYTNYYYKNNMVGISIPRMARNKVVFQIVCKVNGDIEFPLADQIKNSEVYLHAEVLEDKIIYYGGTWSNDVKDINEPYYTTDLSKVGKVVGNLTDRTKIKVSTVPAVDEQGVPVSDKNGNQMKDVVFENLPDETRLVIKYNVTANLSSTGNNSISNDAFWKGHEENSGGGTGVDNLVYETESIAGSISHGALKVHKYDSMDITFGLANAEFELYRAAYVTASPGYIFVNGVEPTEGHYLAVYERVAGSEDPGDEVYINRGSDGQIIGYKYNADDAWTSYDYGAGKNFVHKLAKDDNGNLAVYYGDLLAKGRTDENGYVTYGYTNNLGTPLDKDGNSIDRHEEDRIHFNKVYVIVETKAPDGYTIDHEPHFFVIPNNTFSGQGQNYFYHERWPDGVQVVASEEATYEIDVPNTRNSLTVYKDIRGTGSAYSPGVYHFAIYDEVNGVNPTKDNMLEKVSIEYFESDFGWYESTGERSWTLYVQRGKYWYRENYEVNDGVSHLLTSVEVSESRVPYGSLTYGLLPGHKKGVEFSEGITFGSYYVYELNDAGYPITSVTSTASGTIHGLKYQVSISGAGVDGGSFGHVDYSTEATEFTITNSTYTVDLVKSFRSLAGDGLPGGVSGVYKFAIWPSEEIGTDGMPTTPATAVNTRSLEWLPGDTDVSKKISFSGLQSGKFYYIFELDGDNKPIGEGGLLSYNGTEFMVVYGKSQSDTPDNLGVTIPNKQSTVEVSNVSTVALPVTGGIGTDRLFAMGGLLVLISAGALLHQKRK